MCVYNGERIKYVNWCDKDGRKYYDTVGVKTVKVYVNGKDREELYLLKTEKKNKIDAIKQGRGLYLKYNESNKCFKLVEVSKDEYVNCLWHNIRKDEYRKFRRWEPTLKITTADDNFGIVIIKEEYEYLGIYPLYMYRQRLKPKTHPTLKVKNLEQLDECCCTY